MRTLMVAFVLAAGCVPAERRVELADTTPEELVAHIRQAARDERWSAIYDRLSEAAQEKVSRLAFVIGFPTETTPPPASYKLVRVVARGSFDGVLPDPENPSRAIVFYSYAEPGKPRLDAKVLIVNERGAWRVDGPL